MNRPSKIYVEVEHLNTEPITVKVMEGEILIES